MSTETDDGERRRTLGQRIAEARIVACLSIEAAADLGGVSHTTWRRLERGENVYGKTLDAVDTVFGLRPGSTRSALLSIDDARRFKESISSAADRMLKGNPKFKNIGHNLAALIPTGPIMPDQAHDDDEDLRITLLMIDRFPITHLQRLRDAVDATIRAKERAHLEAQLNSATAEVAVLERRAAELATRAAAARESGNVDLAQLLEQQSSEMKVEAHEAYRSQLRIMATIHDIRERRFREIEDGKYLVNRNPPGGADNGER